MDAFFPSYHRGCKYNYFMDVCWKKNLNRGRSGPRSRSDGYYRNFTTSLMLSISSKLISIFSVMKSLKGFMTWQ